MRAPSGAARATERRRGRDRVVGADHGGGWISWEMGGGGIPGVLTTTLPTPRYILTPRGPQRAADAYRPGWERPGRPSWAGRDGRRCQRGVLGGPVFDRNFRQKFSTYPNFDIPKFASWRWAQIFDPPPGAPASPLPPGAFCPGQTIICVPASARRVRARRRGGRGGRGGRIGGMVTRNRPNFDQVP